MTATLSDIILKTRKLTGTGNDLQLIDATIIDYINSFYLYDFPAQFRSLQLKNVFTINTIQNIDTYPFDFEHYSTLESPANIDKKIVPLYTTPWPFYSLFFNWQNREVFATGDGTDAYTGTAQDIPIIRSYNNNPMADTQTSPVATFAVGSYPATFAEPNIARVQNILITANTAAGTLNVTDDGDGALIGDVNAAGTNTINYQTGAIDVTFSAVIPADTDVTISYNPANPAIPQAILFWQNQITLRPVPDQGYLVEIVAYRRPSQALLGSGTTTNLTGVPELLEWWETLAVGAAKKIYEDRQDMEGVAMMDKMLVERYSLNETRTYAALGKQKIDTIFSDQISGLGGGFFGWGGNNA